jgi:hypothetical protein
MTSTTHKRREWVAEGLPTPRSGPVSMATNPAQSQHVTPACDAIASRARYPGTY